MRKGTGIAGATLLYGPEEPVPDLVLAMQFLIDDLRGSGRRIGGIKLNAAGLRIRSDPFDIVLTLAPAPLPARAIEGVVRPHREPGPDFARVHLARALRRHRHALGFLLRRRGALPPDAETAAHELIREGRLSLLPVIEAAPPALLVWQPGGLALTLAEFRALDPALLTQPGDPESRLLRPTAPDRQSVARPALPPATPKPTSSLDRDRQHSLGTLFGTERIRARGLPAIDRDQERLTAALRETLPRAAAVGAWAALLGGLS